MIREMRKRKKMTLKQLADATGISRVSLNRYELGERTPDVIAAQKIAKALDCSIEDLIKESKEASACEDLPQNR